MGDSSKQSKRVMNPWVLHLQKLALELKCPLCLNLFNGPVLLPCDHMFCDSCLPESTKLVSECPVCNSKHATRESRKVPFMENIVSIYRSLDAGFSANLVHLQSTANGIDKTSYVKHRSAQKDDKNVNNDVLIEGAMRGSNCNQNLNLYVGSSQVSNGRQEESGTGPTEINQVEQLLTGSPPSFSDPKGLDNDTSDQGSDHNPGDYASQTEISFRDGMRLGKHVSSSYGTEEGYTRDHKRQKKLIYGQKEMNLSGDCHNHSANFPGGSSMTANLSLEPKSEETHISTQPLLISEPSSSNKAVCGFCQSSRTSEVTGQMLHFDNGKPVAEDDVFCPNVIHVHSSCIDWAPQVYYEGDNVKNLKAELARSAKLKCSKCGLKGAALGCYVKSCRRSYHAPCATEISKCRWDCDDFLMLCPSHSKVKFPKEKSGPKHAIIPTETSPQPSSYSAAPPGGAKEWVLCGSALSSEEKFLLSEFASKIGAAMTKFWKPNVTHVIAATDEKGACTRTLKVLMAILNGKWVLNINWIKACLEAKHLVDEKLYEVNLDNHGCKDGPKTGRLRVLNNAPKLFNGLKFYFSGEFMPGYKEDLQNLVNVAGGAIVSSKEALKAQHVEGQEAPSKTLIAYNLDAPKGSMVVDEVSTIWERLNEAEELATLTGSQVIGHTWLLESIAAYKLQPIVDCKSMS